VIPSVLIFDIGKTNKKLLLFDEHYNVIYELSVQLKETRDEDGFACEDIHALTQWMQENLEQIFKEGKFDVKAINFSAYGASFVLLDENLKCCTPLYNYLKPFKKETQEKFYQTYGDEEQLAVETASPVLGNLNSGMQLYRLKQEQPQVFEKIKYALHLPQYCSFVVARKLCSEITSIGCHTMLWDFKKNDYHDWVREENIDKLLAPVCASNDVTSISLVDKNIVAGIGLHDSSSALIPYLLTFNEPFVLISTGTWNISLNPFNNAPLTKDELKGDCLCYLTYENKSVKASRLFSGYEHEQSVKRLCSHFNKPLNYHASIKYDDELALQLRERKEEFDESKLNNCNSFEEAYHYLIMHLVSKQIASTNLILIESEVKKIFVDGGFSKNHIFMQMLANHFSGYEVYAASVPQASAIGAALIIHQHWNKHPIPKHLVQIKRFTSNSYQNITTNFQ
jgi:sugar (pentulose or hexulose) kinase